MKKIDRKRLSFEYGLEEVRSTVTMEFIEEFLIKVVRKLLFFF